MARRSRWTETPAEVAAGTQARANLARWAKKGTRLGVAAIRALHRTIQEDHARVERNRVHYEALRGEYGETPGAPTHRAREVLDASYRVLEKHEAELAGAEGRTPRALPAGSSSSPGDLEEQFD